MFRDYVINAFVEAENVVRETKNVPPLGDANPSNTRLFYLVKELLPDHKVKREVTFPWLERQRFDIYLPELKVAIERMGEQHYKPVKKFGGAKSLPKTQARDRRKRLRAAKHGVKVIEVPYECKLTDKAVKKILIDANLPVK